MFKRINKQLQSHMKKARARRDNLQLLSLDDYILRDIGIGRHEILARLGR
ncbi:MAG: hypothetical protein JWS10_466 [Cypionkella sp.]|nr:hypothetical protein [Cypionkella sp.]MDB5657851.1 hypothetical protein [Cypionkella sp.]